MVPPCTAWLSSAVDGRYNPTFVRSSPSSSFTSTRSPTTINSLLPSRMDSPGSFMTESYTVSEPGGFDLVLVVVVHDRAAHELHDRREQQRPDDHGANAIAQRAHQHARPVVEMRPHGAVGLAAEPDQREADDHLRRNLEAGK